MTSTGFERFGNRDWQNLREAALRELPDRAIAIVGFMGAGKTTVGGLLAGRLERPFFDTDPFLEQVTGRTIENFFASGEEAAFRDLEASCIRELVERPPSVIALGGGAFLRAETQELLLAKALVVHLHVSWRTVRGYVGGIADTRPLLRERTLSQIRELYLNRQATYRKAHLSVSAPRIGADRVVERVHASLRSGIGTDAELLDSTIPR